MNLPRYHSLATLRVLLAWALGTAVACIVAGCSSTPAPPLWQVDAKDAMDRATAAYLEGNTRVAQVEMARVRRAISGTGRADYLANAELAFCAAHVASLELQPCQAFDVLRADATPAQAAYAAYLAGQTPSDAVALLPAAQQKIAGQVQGDVAILLSQPEPLTRLVGAAVWLQQGHVSPAVVDLAVDTASQQGWRRPLLAWLGIQLMRAEQAGDLNEIERLRRRIALASATAVSSR